MEYRGALFNLPADPKATNPYVATFSSSYTRGFTPRLSWTLGGQYRFGRGTQRDDTLLTSNLLWRLDNEWSMNFDSLWSRNDGIGVLLGLTWSPYAPSAEAANTVVSSYDTRRKVARADWMRRPAQGQLGLETDVALERRAGENDATNDMMSDTRYDLAGAATYTHERGQLRLRQEATTAGLNNDRTQSANGTTTQFSVASALVFADGAFAISRPVANSFAIVDSNVPLGLNPHFDTRFDITAEDDTEDESGTAAAPLQSRYEARNGTLGGAVLPDLSAYLYRQLSVDLLPDAKSEVKEPTQEKAVVLLPSYRSGTRIKVAVTPRASVRGRLVDAMGTPLALQAGEIHPITTALTAEEPLEPETLEPAAGTSSDDNGTHRIVFTDRNGHFNVHGLPHGHYNLVLANNRHIIPFEVTETPTGVVDIGPIRVDMLADREHRVFRRNAIKFVSGSGVIQ